MDKYKLVLSDTLSALKDIESKSIDLIFADPPYNMQLSGSMKRYDGSNFSGVNDDWDKYKSMEDYISFSYK